ncbi:MAG: Fe-S-containing hydro-lyase [Deltaproteobacteria bacterium]|nr:MAG: Fe-S-containing hydro-lyase [Deltaproteobacteria bacterium]HEC31563.1 Fe-S-containing hydro-lyase [Deltaproteobacteria bacterium]
MSDVIKLTTPLSDADVEKLNIGDRVEITGIIYTGRDAAHKRLVELVKEGKELPFDIKGQIIYYVGPSPAPPGRPVGAAGPTTSYRMDPYAPVLIEAGLKGMIGKGARNQEVIEAMMRFKAVYFAAIGGAGALMAKSIKSAEVIAYPELGPEAVRKLEVVNFPVVVVNDVRGNDLYREGVKKYSRQKAA